MKRKLKMSAARRTGIMAGVWLVALAPLFAQGWSDGWATMALAGPLAVITTALMYRFWKHQELGEGAPAKVSGNGWIAKALAALTVFAAGAGLVVSNTSQYATGGHQSVLQNWGNAGIIAGFVSYILLTSLQGDTYAPFLAKVNRQQLDERQWQVRHRVFERAYVGLIVFTFFCVQNTDLNRPFMRTRLAWVMVLAAVALPPIVASLQKDS